MISIESATTPHSFNSLLLLLLLLLLLPHIRNLKVFVLRCAGKIPFSSVNIFPLLRKNTFKFRTTSTGKKWKFFPKMDMTHTESKGIFPLRCRKNTFKFRKKFSTSKEKYL